jgi:hypothetical protein
MRSIRVAAVEELPPGKGRIVEVAGRQVTVFNCDGRFFGRVSHARRSPVAVGTTHCAPYCVEFDVWVQDSPARLRDEPACRVRIDGDYVYLVVE